MYEFGPFRLDPRRRILLRGQEPVQLTSKAIELLLVLIDNRERVVLKDELLKTLWPRSIVEESNLTQNVFMVRKALGEVAHEHRYIVTVPGKGYRFAADVRQIQEPVSESIAAPVVLSPPAAEVARGRWRAPMSIAIVALAAIGAGVFWFLRPATKLSPTDTILIADFENQTREPVFDGFLRRALAIGLEQSPYLKILSDDRVADVLRRMQRPVEAPRTRAVALEVCQRENLKAVISGSIARLNRTYVLSLEAIACRSGERIASVQARAGDQDQVIDALDSIGATMRKRLGESLASVEKFDRSLRIATTPSLEALKAFTKAADIMRFGTNESLSIPLFERAIELDPEFALAYSYLAVECYHLGESQRAEGFQRKAYALRDRVTQREQLLIVSNYHMMVSGDLDQEMAAYESWRAEFPRDWIPLTQLGAIYGAMLGDYAKEAEIQSEAWQREPGQSFSPVALAWDYLALNRIADARAALERALAEKLDGVAVRSSLYRVAIMQGDPALADAQRHWSAMQPVQENITGALAADLMQQGRMREARELLAQQAQDLGEHGFKESAAGLVAWLALSEAELGEGGASAKNAAWSSSLAGGRTNLGYLGLALALAGETQQAESFVAKLQDQYPHDFPAHRVFIPLTQAALAIRRGNPEAAIAMLEPLRRYDFGSTWSFLPPYLRGIGYLEAKRGKDAAMEFQKVVDQRGISPLSPEWALALVGLARAHAATGDVPASRASYQRVLSLWKNADPDLAIVQRVRLESQKLSQG
jgi:DNA-binding winged helix-turn-helix (wHTH) protein/tetratricopeptide (TPR) repeat protein